MVEHFSGTMSGKQWRVASALLANQAVSTSIEIRASSGRVVDRAGFRGTALAEDGRPNSWVGLFDGLPPMVVARVPRSTMAAEIEGTIDTVPGFLSAPMPGADFRVVAAFLPSGNEFVAVRTTG